MDTVNKETYDLGVSNPNLSEEAPEVKELIEEMKYLDKENQSILDEIEKILK